MRFKEFSEAVTPPEGETFAMKVYRAMQAADDYAAQRSTTGGATANAPAGADAAINIRGGAGAGGVDPKQVASYLKSKGMDNNHVLGILANIKGESGFNPGIAGDGGASVGFFQYNASRRKNMINFVGSDWATDWKGQIDFALSEPEGQRYLSTRFSTPAEATEWWTRYFERPKYASADVQKRVGFLSQFT